MLAHGFQPLLAGVAQTERCLYLIPLIIYDREIEGADLRAMRCHDQLLSELRDLGYPPYRLGVQSMQALPQANDDSPALQQRLKTAFDPANILAPGRYPPPHSNDE